LWRAASEDGPNNWLQTLWPNVRLGSKTVMLEVPVLLDSTPRVEAIKNIIVECCGSGDTLVASDKNGAVVDLVLAKPDVLERFYDDNAGLSLRYIGVAKTCRGQGIFSALMQRLKDVGEPLTADVLHGNQSGMSDRLVKAGFLETKSNDKERSFRWSPSWFRSPQSRPSCTPLALVGTCLA
jgi:GNAT superfamily N-acetyltransferase